MKKKKAHIKWFIFTTFINSSCYNKLNVINNFTLEVSHCNAKVQSHNKLEMLSTGRRHLILFRSLGIHFNTSHIFNSTNVTVILVLGCINIRRCVLSFGNPPWNHSQHPSCLTSFVCWPLSFSSVSPFAWIKYALSSV